MGAAGQGTTRSMSVCESPNELWPAEGEGYHFSPSAGARNGARNRGFSAEQSLPLQFELLRFPPVPRQTFTPLC